MFSKLIESLQNYLDAFKNIARIQNVFVQADNLGISVLVERLCLSLHLFTKFKIHSLDSVFAF
jgi:hypothetical protein